MHLKWTEHFLRKLVNYQQYGSFGIVFWLLANNLNEPLFFFFLIVHQVTSNRAEGYEDQHSHGIQGLIGRMLVGPVLCW